MNAYELEKMLAEKHREDVFVPQCKDGASYGAGLLILDAWAMRKSWANPCVTGYEIKVSRSDFQRDEKWRGYLDYCNEFYFVCPAGLLRPEEIPEPAGLMCAAKTGGVLFRKKKAIRREPVIPASIYQYILMSRTRISREFHPTTKREYWEKWLETEKLDRSFGYKVGKRLGAVIQKRIHEAEGENKRLADLYKDFEDVRAMLADMGIGPGGYWGLKRKVEQRIQDLQSAVPPELHRAVDSVLKYTDELRKQLSRIQTVRSEVGVGASPEPSNPPVNPPVPPAPKGAA